MSGGPASRTDMQRVAARHGCLTELTAYVAAHPWARALELHVRHWILADGALAEFQDPADGALRGQASRDLGDVTPYLWLLGDLATIERVHAAAAAKESDGLLVRGGQIHAFDNHDYVLSFYLVYRLTGEERWRDGFLDRCAALRERFFGVGMPPAWVGIGGRRSLKRSAFGYGLLELFCLAHECDPMGPWLEAVATELPGVSRLLDRQVLAFMPRAAAGLGGVTVGDLRGGRLFARLFKDNSNLIHALLAYFDATGDRTAAALLRRLVGSIDAALLRWGDGWVRTELRRRDGRLVAEAPALVGNAVVIELARVLSGFPYLADLLPREHVQHFVDTPLAAWQRQGLLPAAPGASRQHLDIMVDFATAAALWFEANGEAARARAVVARALEGVARHETPFGLATLAGPDGPVGDLCVKYNYLALKLPVCRFLLQHAPCDDLAGREQIAELFLIDR